jgi:hypothetical protein
MTVPLPVLGNVLGQLGNWVAGVFERIGDVSIYWLVLALGLKTAESAFLGLGWRNILRAAYPKSNLSFKIAWGASQGGTAINAITIAFHREVRADRWMLYHHTSTFAGDGMTHSECRVHDEEGELLASFTVDAMVRPFADPAMATDERRAL